MAVTQKTIHSLKDMTDVFRILSPSAILGYGFPEESFNRALEQGIDLIAVDAGSIDAGPYYLGSNKHYVGIASLERDLTIMIKGSLAQKCPCIIGSAGFSGANPQCDEVVEIVKKIIAAESDRPVKLSVIHSDISSKLIASNIDKLQALGRMPELTVDRVISSKIVGQMGIEPIMTALKNGAEIIVCGRAYDPAVFAAAPVAKGFDPGICYHVGKILECGAIACVPGSGSDCLIAEIYADGHAEFYTGNPARKCTPGSIAAHSLYEKSRPDYFYLPGGILSIQNTSFYQVDKTRTGIKGSTFISQDSSIKLEACCHVGARTISIFAVNPKGHIDHRIPVYGRNGVEKDHSKNELGIIAVVSSNNAEAAHDVLANLRSGILHYGYPGRISTAGNVAFPCSPSDMDCSWKNKCCSFFIAGTRDPIFQEKWPLIRSAVVRQVKEQLPALYEKCSIEFFTTDKQKGFVYIETCSDEDLHQSLVDSIQDSRLDEGIALERIDAGMVYEWTLYHLISDPKILKYLFPIQSWEWQKPVWQKTGKNDCDWTNSLNNNGQLPDEQRGVIPDLPLSREAKYKLTDITDIIRSKNAGINEITYDIFFKTDMYFNYAVDSGVFTNSNISQILNIPETDIIACLNFPIVNAIKITVHRQYLAGNIGDRDIFGAQQHSAFLQLNI